MKLQPLILESKPCLCSGKGKLEQITCPVCLGTGRGKRGGKNGCKECSGLKYKLRYNEIKEDCPECHGSLSIPETMTDYIPKEEFKKIPIKVIRQERKLSWFEQTFGVGLYSCVDYGRSREKTDEELAESVRGHTHQLCKVYRDRLCDYVGVFVGDNGYSVVGLWKEK